MNQSEYLKSVFAETLQKIGVPDSIDSLKFETPKNPEHGDMATNIAMQLAKPLRQAPAAIAQKIIDNLQFDSNIITDVNIAGAGFINIKFSNQFYIDALKSITLAHTDYGKAQLGKGIKINIEYVSANPTGLLHLGHGRNAAIGDTVANLYDWLGYEVTREYYFNNAGNQMNNLALSIHARYMQLLGNADFELPENAYHGEYIKTIAQEVIDKHGDKYKAGTKEDLEFLKVEGEKWNFAKIRETMNKMNVHQDVYFNEDSLYKDGKIDAVVAKFREKNLAYDKDGATWLKLSEMGQEQDKVIIKTSGEPTYRLPDIAYHAEKYERGFDIIIDVFGSDHIATIPDVMSGVEYLGYDKSKIKVLLYQFVTLTENGEQVKMSKRTGKSYTLDELLDEVGEDVVRFFLIMRNITTHLEFDLALAKEQSDKNPVFYLQYAHARICSVLDNARAKGTDYTDANLNLLQHEKEITLIKSILRFPEVIKQSADRFEPHTLCEYLKSIASDFHNFYHDCRILADNVELSKARLYLSVITKYVMKNGLTILGITAPEKM